MTSFDSDRNKPGRYVADITAGSLLVHESRKVATLLRGGLTPPEIKSRVIIENLFQKRSPETASRQCRLILKRLLSMSQDFWAMISDGPLPLTKQALLACAIKDSRFLGDFMRDVVKSRARAHDDQLRFGDWDRFLEMCELIDPEVTKLKESTRKKLRQVIIRILVESGYLENRSSMKLTPIRIEPAIEKLLLDHDEKYVLKCMEVYE